MFQILNKQIKIKFYNQIKKLNLKYLFNKEFKEIKKIKLDVIREFKLIKNITFMKFKFNKEQKQIKLPFKIVFLNEIKKISLNFKLHKTGIDELFNIYSNNIFINKNKDYLLDRFDLLFEAYLLHNKENRKKLISDLNKFLLWIDTNNFYYLNQIDTIDYKTFWRL